MEVYSPAERVPVTLGNGYPFAFIALTPQIFSEDLRLCSYYKDRRYTLTFFYLTMMLTEDQLDTLIKWYGRTVYTTENEQFFHNNGLIEPVYAANADDRVWPWGKVGGPILKKGFILSKKAREIVKRREPLRLVIELMSRVSVSSSLSINDLTDIVNRIPFTELPQILACDDAIIRDLAERKLRKRKFLASMR